jgi:hypothetical protein
MKKRYIYFFAALAAVTALAVSCMNPLNPPSNTTTEGAGQVVLTVSTGEAGFARTILPVEPPSFSRYELSFSKDGANTVSVADTTNITETGVSQELAAGTWTASVNAYRMFTPTGDSATEYLAAQGSAQVTVNAGQFTPVTVFIAPVPIIGSLVKGIFTYTVNFPDGASGTLRIGNESPVPLTSGQTISLELDPGYYDLFISLTDQEGQSTGAAQKVHIYSGLESKAVYTFVNEDFNGSLLVPSTLPPEALSATLLTYNTWADGNIFTAGQVNWYKITAATTTTYYLRWDDAWHGEGGKTLIASVSMYRADGTLLFANSEEGYFYPQYSNISAGETVYVQVEGTPNYPTGTYAIQYYDPAVEPPKTAIIGLRVAGHPAPACVVTWESALGAEGYTVYRSSSANGTYNLLETINDRWTPYYTDTDVSVGTTYYYKVNGINSNGEGPQSAAVSAIPVVAGIGESLTPNTWTDGNFTTEEQVDWYKFTASTGATYYLQWDDADSGSNKTSYIGVSTYSSDGFSVFTNYSASPQSFSVSAGETVYVRVVSTWSLGTYAIQYYDSASVLPQKAPGNVKVEGHPAPACIVAWNPVSGATGYNVYRSTSADGTYSPLNVHLETLNDEWYYHLDTNVSTGTRYYYKVSATNSHGEGPQSLVVSDMPPVLTSIPTLAYNTWTEGNITTKEQVDWYKVTASTDETYYPQWDNKYEGTNAYYGAIRVSAYRTDGMVFFGGPNSYIYPQYFNISAGETVYVRVAPDGDIAYDWSWSLGTYAIRYYDSAMTPGDAGITVNFIGPQDETINLSQDVESLSHAANTPISISVNGSFTAYKWFLDGVFLEGATGSSISANTGELAVKRHELTVFVTTSSGVEYAKSMYFIITE